MCKPALLVSIGRLSRKRQTALVGTALNICSGSSTTSLSLALSLKVTQQRATNLRRKGMVLAMSPRPLHVLAKRNNAISCVPNCNRCLQANTLTSAETRGSLTHTHNKDQSAVNACAGSSNHVSSFTPACVFASAGPSCLRCDCLSRHSA
eukprot:5440046-Amphidinium_carterae.1